MLLSMSPVLFFLSFTNAATIGYLTKPRPLAALVASFFDVNNGPLRNGFISFREREYRPSALGAVVSSRFSDDHLRDRKKLRPRQDGASPTTQEDIDSRPTPAPTGDPSPSTTVHISNTSDFALLLPSTPGELISDAESDGATYCTSSSSGCNNYFPDGLITGSAISQADDGSWIQITGCIDSSKFPFASGDDGGQFDVRFPNGAQCAFGGYGASFIEQVEPTANRFCLRCCSSENDQTNCNSHQSQSGCLAAIPGTYDFSDVSCST